MLNKKVIVLAGFTRGGTNITWNILQSHPAVCSSRYETGTIFRKNHQHSLRSVTSILKKTGLLNSTLGYAIIDYKLYKIKMTNFHHTFNRFIYEDQPYTRKQIHNSALCFKSVDYDIEHTKLLMKIYPDLYFIALVRNGYALANGHIRRGSTVSKIAGLYHTIAEKMRWYSDNLKNFKIVKFEDILNRPYEKASEIFDFVNLQPNQLEKMCFKSKKLLSHQGEHKISFGKEHQKYWVGKEEIHSILDPSITERQIGNLSKKDINSFNKDAGKALDYFGYERR